MRLNKSAATVLFAVVLAGCSSTGNQLTVEGQRVRFVDTPPSADCKLLGKATGVQSNWLTAQQPEGGNALRGAANNLRNQAAMMGGNVIYDVSTPAMSLVSNFIPVSTKMSGQVFRCPEGQ